MIPNKGRYLDCNPINQPPGTWRKGKNFVVNRKKAAFVVEPGTDVTATNFPFATAKPIGTATFPDESYVVWADGINGGKDRIGIVDKSEIYTDVIVDDILNLSASFPIRSVEIDYNAFGERIVGFTDFNNEFRVLNIDNLPFVLNPDRSLLNPLEISDIEGFPKLKNPIINFVINQIGGSVKSGVYSAALAYENNDGTRTPSSPPQKIIYITDDSASVGFDKFDGVPARTSTPKSITFNISNVDTRYDKLVLIVIRKFGGQTEITEAKKIDISGTTATITYIGSETETTLTTEEVLTPRPLYTKVKAIAQINSQLYLGNLEAQPDIEYQAYANNIRVYYNSTLVTVGDLNRSHKNGLSGGFSHGGVYAFYIAFVLKNGSWSRAFHIPGRANIGGTSTPTPITLNRTGNIITPHEPGTWNPSLFSQINFNNSEGYITTSSGINITTGPYAGFKIVVEATPSYAVFQHTFGSTDMANITINTTVVIVTGGDADVSALAVPNGLPANTKVYQIEDTTNKASSSYTFDGDTIIVSSTAGPSNMGYWENQNEKYPAGFPGGLGGQAVRHHVFPTIRKCKQIHYSASNSYGRDQLDVLGIDVANVVIPAELQDKIEGWAIFYADRTYSNSNTLGTDLYLVAHKTDTDASIVWSAGGNWRTRSFDGSGPWELDFDINPDYLRGHNFELLKDKPALSPSSLFIDFELKYKKENTITSFLTHGKAGGSIAMSGEGQGQNAGMAIDLTDTINNTVSLPPAPLLRAVEEFKYLPTGIIDGNIRTLKNEEIIHLKIFQGDTIPLTKSEVHINSEGRTPNTFPTNVAGFTNGGEESYLITYKQIKTDVYNEFNNQILVMTDQMCLPSESFKRKIRGGDTFVSVRSFLSVSPRHANDFDKINGTTVVRAHISESRYNIGLRHELLGDVTTRYYPKTPAQNFWENPGDPDANGVQMIFDRTQNPNGLAYNSDYNETNKYNQLIIYTTNQRLTNKFPYRVIRGGATNGARSDINGWKTFLSADYYESNRNRGEISDLFVIDDNLFIHHYFGLFRTLGTEKLSLSTTEVYLGSGDVFAQRPKELITTKNGFLGSQNQFAAVSLKGGRFWCDQSQGRVIMLSKQGVNEISADGMYEFFRDNLKIDNTYPDNPIGGEGLVATYDPKYDRIILAKKSNVNPFTVSYSVEKEQGYWCFDHDYTPDYLFNTSTNFYGFKNNRIHKFNSSTREARYFEGDPQTSEVEIIFNEENHRNKNFFNINWISEVFDKSGALLKTKTLTGIRVKTSYQDSGLITLTPFTAYGNNHNIRRYKNTWNFNRFKDTNNDPFKKKALVDNYCSVTFIFNNTPNLDGTQNSLYLYLLNAKAILAEL